jgi:hypothetical protein
MQMEYSKQVIDWLLESTDQADMTEATDLLQKINSGIFNSSQSFGPRKRSAALLSVMESGASTDAAAYIV